MTLTKLIAKFVVLAFFSLGAFPGTTESEPLWIEKNSSPVVDETVISNSLFTRLTEAAGPAVVNIRIMMKITPSYRDYPRGFPPGGPGEQPGQGDYQQRGEGSGFIIHPDGYIVTNAHVALQSDQLQVALENGKLYWGRVLGADQMTDIALLKIDAAEPLPTLPLGDSDKLRRGEWVLAIGSPFGLDQTVTAGIVSGKGRSLGANPYDDYVQIDAPINPGNSGGPLINMRGEAVGINTAILQQGQGLGFSVPINLAKKLLPRLKSQGKIIRGWLGVHVQDISLTLKEEQGLTVDSGSYITTVIAGGPAEKAGIRPGDVVIRFGDVEIRNSRALPSQVAHTEPEAEVPVTLIRKGKTLTVTVRLQPVPKRPR